MNRIAVIVIIGLAMFAVTSCKKEKQVKVDAPVKDVPTAVIPTTEVKPVVVVPETMPEPKPAK